MSNTSSLSTPRGIARFPKLVTPDEYKGKLTYKTDLVLDPTEPEAAKLIEQLTGIRDTALAEYRASEEKAIQALKDAKKGAAANKKQAALDSLEIPCFVKDQIDQETGDATGKVYLSFKTNATTKDGATKTLRFFDADAKPFKPSGDIQWGSELRVNFAPVPQVVANKMFLTNYINAVQVIRLNGGGGGSAEDMGFGAVDGGFQADTGGFVEEPTGDEGGPADY